MPSVKRRVKRETRVAEVSQEAVSTTPDSSRGLVGSSELPTRNRKAPETVRKTRVAKQPDLVTEFRGRSIDCGET